MMPSRIRSLFTQADGIVILAGAGMSVDSGLPDFRGKTGMWTQAQEDFITLASAKGFASDPLRVWNFYINRILQYAHTEPHQGYSDLLKLIHAHDKDVFVVTSNVDGHFQKAGYPVHAVHEIHGSLQHAQCAQACDRQVVPMPKFTCELTSVDEIPCCDKCGHMLRPNVMMFSDAHLVWRRIDQGAAEYSTWCAPKMNLLGIEIGAGTQIPSIRLFGEEKINYLIRINPHDSAVTRPQDVSVKMKAMEGIQYVINCVNSD